MKATGSQSDWHVSNCVGTNGSWEFFALFYFVNIIELLPSYEVIIEGFQPEGGCFLERFPRD